MCGALTRHVIEAHRRERSAGESASAYETSASAAVSPSTRAWARPLA
jgi:hypothetical protein